MKQLMKRIALFALAVLTLGSALPTAAFADAKPEPVAVVAASPLEAEALEAPRLTFSLASSFSKVKYALRVASFLQNSRYKNGASWGGSKRPYLSGWSCSGCMAYAVDFCKYVYGADWATSPKKFETYKSVKDIATGDAIRINGHYFVVLQRKGDKLYTAEGNYGSSVRASLTSYGYYISGGCLYQNYYNAKGTSTGHAKVTFVSGYRFK